MRRPKKASVLLIVLVTVALTAFALLAFIDRASNDLMVEARAAEAAQLRTDAYSALEVTLGVLNEFIQADGALHSPAEGWSDPLGFAGYEPPSGRTVDVTFEDESGKLSLPHADSAELTSLFQSWGVSQSDSQQLTDALLGWMRKDYVPATSVGTTDYDRSPLPYVPPERPLRSFDELAAIDVVREKFYDENGRPNDLWRRFVAAFSLYDFSQPNLNSAGADTYAALGQANPAQVQQISDYLKGTGEYKQRGPAYFKTTKDATSLFGAQNLPSGVGTQILALRVIVTVHDGNRSFTLNTVIAPPNGAKAVPSSEPAGPPTSMENNPTQPNPAGNGENSGGANNNNGGTNNNNSQTNNNNGNNSSTASRTGIDSSTSAGSAPVPQLNYPFTLLEIHEGIAENNAAPASSPAPTVPATPPSS